MRFFDGRVSLVELLGGHACPSEELECSSENWPRPTQERQTGREGEHFPELVALTASHRTSSERGRAPVALLSKVRCHHEGGDEGSNEDARMQTEKQGEDAHRRTEGQDGKSSNPTAPGKGVGRTAGELQLLTARRPLVAVTATQFGGCSLDQVLTVPSRSNRSDEGIGGAVNRWRGVDERDESHLGGQPVPLVQPASTGRHNEQAESGGEQQPQLGTQENSERRNDDGAANSGGSTGHGNGRRCAHR